MIWELVLIGLLLFGLLYFFGVPLNNLLAGVVALIIVVVLLILVGVVLGIGIQISFNLFPMFGFC